MQSHEHSPWKTFIITFPYNRQGKADSEVSKNSVSLVWRRGVFEDLDYKDDSNCCLLIVIVYAKSVNRGITNKAIVVVYIKLWTVTHRIVRTTKKFIETEPKCIFIWE